MSEKTPEEIEALRFRIVGNVVNKMVREGVALTDASVKNRIASSVPDFDFDPQLDDWTRHVSNEIPATPTREAASDVQGLNAPAVVGTMAAVETPDTMTKPPVDADAVRFKVLTLDLEVAEARARMTGATHKVREARARLASAVAQWQRGIPRMSDEQMRREYLATSLAERKAQAEAGGPQAAMPHADSVIDAGGAYATSGGADAFVRKQLNTGHRRGAMPASQKGRRFLPSQR